VPPPVPATLAAPGAAFRAACFPAALPVGPGQAAAALRPPPTAPFYADAGGGYGHLAAAYPGHLPFSAAAVLGAPAAAQGGAPPARPVGPGIIGGGPAAAPAAARPPAPPPPPPVSGDAAAALDGANGRPPAANPALPPFPDAAGADGRGPPAANPVPLPFKFPAAAAAAPGGAGHRAAASIGASGSIYPLSSPTPAQLRRLQRFRAPAAVLRLVTVH
jgi:hypothetical protein